MANITTETHELIKERSKLQVKWDAFKSKHPTLAQFIVFFLFSNGVTILQFLLMPLFRFYFSRTDLININFQIWQVGQNIDGSAYFVFNYAAGPILSDGTGGGLAYFLSVQITIAIAQIINFFAQRNITFKSNTNPWIAAMWYFIAYIVITMTAAILQGFYKAPIYEFFITTLGLGSRGETISDVITMFINSMIAFWVFFPIFKVIFKRKEENIV
ncbi:MAG: hypothetical protein ACNA7U_00945 [Candidatus Izemoplasmataceae bacterium]